LLIGILGLFEPLGLAIESGQVVEGRGDIGQVGRESGISQFA
jgi:hypothetical protein